MSAGAFLCYYDLMMMLCFHVSIQFIEREQAVIFI